MKRAIVGVLAISLGLLLKSCNTVDPPPGDKPTLALKLEDVSCTEAWIQLTTNNLQLPTTVTLKQINTTGDTKSHILNLNTKDSLLYVDSLLPNKSYNFIVSHSGLSGISSNELSVTTMDTTSHNFTFESWTFGTIGSSTLYDVAIINENNIWCVGEINIADTSINGYTTYNAVHWDGIEWQLHRIMFYTICGQQNRTSYPASSIFAFSENDIWIGMDGDQIARHNGIAQGITYCLPFSYSINKIWGQSPSSMYAVGDGGNISFFNGTQWSRIESGTELNINDIWGDFNEKTGEWEILAVASNYGTSLEKEILLIKDNVVINIPPSSQMWPLLTTWFISNRQYYVAGAGIYQKRLLIDELWVNNATDITTFATTSIRGNNINDVIGVGAFGDFVHFNGVNWKNDYEEPLLSNGSYTKVTVKGGLVVAVGGNQVSINSEAVILIGRR